MNHTPAHMASRNAQTTMTPKESLRPNNLVNATGGMLSILVFLIGLHALSDGGVLAQATAASPARINPPLGPYVNLKPADFADTSSFGPSERVVTTAYFYWYDVYTSAHIINSDGSDALTDHPPTLAGFSYKSKSWHRTELLDMIEAGIDVVLPVYWGEPSQRVPGQPVSAQPWSFSGLPPLVQAREELLSQGKKPPAIGMFYDTSTLQHNAAGRRIDLTTDYGRQWFYESIRDFFSIIPPKHWAMIDGHPVVFLYSAAFAAKHDQTCVDYLRTAFAQDFGGRTPYIVREISWQVQSDTVYAWGGALGLKNPGTASLGPGYDHSAVPGREPLIVNREGGAFFERNWVRFLRNPSPLVMIETWNEFHEGTDIAASKEYGRQYIELNRRYVDMFKRGVRPPRPRGPFSDFKEVSVVLQATNETRGLFQLEHADGVTEAAEADGRPCRATVATQHGGRYVYFRIDDSFKWTDRMLVNVEVDYFDAADGSFSIDYDGSDTNAPFQGAYTSSALNVSLRRGQTWKTASFRLSGARFENSQNGGADFRISVRADPFYVGRVTVKRLGVPAESGQVLRGFQQDFAQPLATNWLVLGPEPAALEQANDLLVARVLPGPPRRLVLGNSDASADPGEILARMRVVDCQGTNALFGGVSLGFNIDHGTGLDFGLSGSVTGDQQAKFGGSGLTSGPTADFHWTTNRWYWLRLRHEANSITHYPDLLARVWLADGETPEPIEWLDWWDYYPAAAIRRGCAGLVIGGGFVQATVEFDYVLVKADGLPEITACLPPLKLARSFLVPIRFSPETGFHLALNGEPKFEYALESSADFSHWAFTSVTTDAHGTASIVDAGAGHESQRFYRASASP